MRKIFLFVALSILVLTACTSGVEITPDFLSTTEQASSPTATILPLEIATPEHTPTPIVQKVWADASVPPQLREQISLPTGWEWSLEEQSPIHLIAGGEPSISRWIYALVAPFPTVEDDFSTTQLKELWQKGKDSEEGPNQILVSPSTAAAISTLWGTPSAAVRIVSEQDILPQAWEKPNTWAIVPFEHLAPQWKVLSLDGLSPIQKNLDVNQYPLQISFGWAGDPEVLTRFLRAWEREHPETFAITNRDENLLTTLVLTGVTALVRGTAALMERNGMEYPAQDIGDWLRDADILHINN